MISVICVLYNSDKVYPAFRDSLKNISEDYEVLVKDNTNDNIGLSKATNLLVSKARGDIFIFSNPDIRIDSTINEMIGFVKNHSFIGAVPYLSPVDVSRRMINVARLFSSMTYIGGFFYSAHFRFVRDDYEHNTYDVVEQPGSFIVISERAVRSLRNSNFGQFYDERFPVYWGDVDLAKRAEILGIRFKRFPSTFYHLGGHSAKSINLEKRLMFFYSRVGMIGFAKKWSMHPSLIELILFLDTIAVFVTKLFRRLKRTKRESFEGRVLGAKEASRAWMLRFRTSLH